MRQGNKNSEVQIYRYATNGTFDSYLWQTVESKQKFIAQIMTSKSPARSCEDVDTSVLQYSTLKALATGNPLIIEHAELQSDVNRLKTLKTGYLDDKYDMERAIMKTYPLQIEYAERDIKNYEADIAVLSESSDKDFCMEINGVTYTEKTEAGNALLDMRKKIIQDGKDLKRDIGSYRGFILTIHCSNFFNTTDFILTGNGEYKVEMGDDAHGNITRIENKLNRLPSKLEEKQNFITTTQKQMEEAKRDIEIPFEHEAELSEKKKRLAYIENQLGIGKSEDHILYEEELDEDEYAEDRESEKEREAELER